MALPNDDQDEARQRYQRVLDEFSKFTRDFQDYKLAREQALSDLERRIVEQIQVYWKATAFALRQLSDWQAETEDKADRERTVERWIQRGSAAIIILLLAIEVYLRLRGSS